MLCPNNTGADYVGVRAYARNNSGNDAITINAHSYDDVGMHVGSGPFSGMVFFMSSKGSYNAAAGLISLNTLPMTRLDLPVGRPVGGLNSFNIWVGSSTNTLNFSVNPCQATVVIRHVE